MVLNYNTKGYSIKLCKLWVRNCENNFLYKIVTILQNYSSYD